MSELSESQMDAAACDRRLVEQILAGDPGAFEGLVQAYQQPAFNLAYRMLGERGEAEDATQEAFLRAYRNLHRYDTERSFKTWLLTITSNHCIDRLRRRRLTLLSIDEPLPAHPSLTSKAPDPEDAAISGERSEALQALLAKLSPDYRLVVVLRYWYDYSYTEIAKMTDTTESAVKSKLFRARRALAEMLESQPAGHLMPAALEG